MGVSGKFGVLLEPDDSPTNIADKHEGSAPMATTIALHQTEEMINQHRNADVHRNAC